MGPINQNAMARGLLDWFGDDRPVVDRATLLPIGQYEDGSLTFAWPGFLKDAWEGAQRTYLDAGNVPVPDAAPGTRWSSNVDALNAASIAPMAGVAGRAAGAIPRGALGASANDVHPARPAVNYDLLPTIEPTERAFSYRVTANGERTPLTARGTVNGDEAFISWIGDWNNQDSNVGDLGVRGLRQLREAIRRDYPDVKRFAGDRISGALPDRVQSVRMNANDSRAALPALMAQPQGLLGGEPQPALPPLFASAEPYLLERPTEPVMGPFEMPGRWDFPFDLDRQKWQDERYQSPIDLPAPEDQFRPTFRPFAGLMR